MNEKQDLNHPVAKGLDIVGYGRLQGRVGLDYINNPSLGKPKFSREYFVDINKKNPNPPILVSSPNKVNDKEKVYKKGYEKPINGEYVFEGFLDDYKPKIQSVNLYKTKENFETECPVGGCNLYQKILQNPVPYSDQYPIKNRTKEFFLSSAPNWPQKKGHFNYKPNIDVYRRVAQRGGIVEYFEGCKTNQTLLLVLLGLFGAYYFLSKK